MVLCPDGLSDEVDLWNCIQKPLILPILPGAVNAHASGGGTYSRAGGEKARDPRRAFRRQTDRLRRFRLRADTVTEPEKDDLVFETDGAKLYVALQAMPFIDGTEVDYVREGLNQLFKFHNPKAQNECGCGESFGV
jgi:hypothetical protein